MSTPTPEKAKDDIKASEAISYLSEYIEDCPGYLVMAGTGLGDCARFMEAQISVSYADIPHFPVSTVESHAGKLVFGKINHNRVAVMMGRFHLYEGYSPRQVTFPIRVMQGMGVHTVIVSNASGGLSPSFSPGDIMIIRDHINLTNENPLVGTNIDAWGLRFPDMIHAYDPDLAETALKAANHLGLAVKQGVYAGLKGPSLETPAEMRFLRIIGADAVGFSTVQEVIAARHGGMRVLGLSVITNRCDPDNPEPATVDQVISVAGKASPHLERLIEHIISHGGHSE